MSYSKQTLQILVIIFLLSYKDITETALHLFECVNVGDSVIHDYRIF